MNSLEEAAYWAFCHFRAMDEANAAIHCAPVRYSPITVRLATGLVSTSDDPRVYIDARELLASLDYDLDPGR